VRISKMKSIGKMNQQNRHFQTVITPQRINKN
jgi:hypothetical protein